MNYKVTLCDEYTCTQCFACLQVCPKQCISLKDAGAGFRIPDIDRNYCIECALCMKSCHQIKTISDYQSPLKAFACWTKNLDDREHSSSGGAFSALASRVIELGGVVFGATMENLVVRHIAIEKKEDIRMLQGSKYLQSDMTGVYDKVKACIKDNRQVLFTGTPCQVNGLYSYLKRKPENLITCDIVCHGVPSQKAFDIWIDKIGIRHNSMSVGFRFTKGWGYQMSRIIKSPISMRVYKRIIMPVKGYYIRAFSEGYMFNESCYNCKYAQPQRISDITIADYWGLGSVKPFNYPRHKGISMMLANNERGLNFINSCPQLFGEERPLEEAIIGNGNLNSASSRPIGRDTYYEDSQNMSYKSLQNKYNLKPVLRDYLRIIKQFLIALR